MSGGAYEYIAGCYTENTDKLTVNSNYIGKYKDVYEEYSSSKYGDAIFETSFNSSGSNSWFSDYSIFVNSNYPVFRRGGNTNSSSGAGLFSFNYDSGISHSSYGFRPVFVVR